MTKYSLLAACGFIIHESMTPVENQSNQSPKPDSYTELFVASNCGHTYCKPYLDKQKNRA
jgi:hypothetical protein